jgi:hypothetical protein
LGTGQTEAHASGDSAEELVAEIQKEIVRCRRHARRNYFSAYTLFVLALAATVAAVFISASGSPPWLRALVTAIPGFVVLINGTLKFQQKERWYWTWIRKLETLERKIRFEGESLANVSHELSTISERLEGEWPTFEPVPTQPSSRPRGSPS